MAGDISRSRLNKGDRMVEFTMYLQGEKQVPTIDNCAYEPIDIYSHILDGDKRHLAYGSTYGRSTSSSTMNPHWLGIAKALVTGMLREEERDVKYCVLTKPDRADNSTAMSALRATRWMIESLGLSSRFFFVYGRFDTQIECRRSGCVFRFIDIHSRTGLDSLKGMSGLKIAWIDGVERLDADTWDFIRPCFRYKESKIIFSFEMTECSDFFLEVLKKSEEDMPQFIV